MVGLLCFLYPRQSGTRSKTQRFEKTAVSHTALSFYLCLSKISYLDFTKLLYLHRSGTRLPLGIELSQSLITSLQGGISVGQHNLQTTCNMAFSAFPLWVV